MTKKSKTTKVEKENIISPETMNQAFDNLYMAAQSLGFQVVKPYTFVKDEPVNFGHIEENINNLAGALDFTSMKFIHANGGCIQCGTMRVFPQEMAKGVTMKDRNIYVKNDKMGDIILGLCGACYHRADKAVDLVLIKKNLVAQEKMLAGNNQEALKKIAEIEASEFLSAYRR